MAVLAATLAMVACGFAGTTRASADVCTGNPYEASGAPESRVQALVPFLASPRWSKEMLPPWEAERSSTPWTSELAYAWYRYARLWGTTGTAAWWVMPGVGCDIKGEAEPAYGTVRAGAEYVEYPAEVCVLVYAQLSIESSTCENKLELSKATPPVEAERNGQRLLSGFAPAGTGSVEVRFQNGSATFPAVGGIYGGSVNADVGKALSATDLPAAVARTPAHVLLVDQTGLFSTISESRPRMKSVAARIHARIPSTSTLNLGHAVAGRLPHDSVLYAAGAGTLAKRVARALRTPAPRPLGAGESKMFGDVAQVVVLVGRTD
jgi:hypothetical protein